MAAGQKAVESTVTEEIIQTMVKEDRSPERGDRSQVKKDRFQEKEGLLVRIRKEGALEATDRADLILKTEKEDRSRVKKDHSQVKEGLLVRIRKEGALEATDRAGLILKTEKEDHSRERKDHSPAREGHLETRSHSPVREDHMERALTVTEGSQAASEIQERRVSTRRTSIISVMSRRAESTR